jgi:hypothetical protein
MHTFPSLVGSSDRNKVIANELGTLGIPIVGNGKKMFGLHGAQGGFSFYRGVDSWLSVGSVPLSVAILLYNDPVGKRNILVMANKKHPAPDEKRSGNTDWDKKVHTRIGESVWAKETKHRLVIPIYSILTMEAFQIFLRTLKENNVL